MPTITRCQVTQPEVVSVIKHTVIGPYISKKSINDMFLCIDFQKKKHSDFFVFSVFSSDVFEKALNAGFIQATDYVEIWQAYLDYLRRRVDFSKGESSHVWNCLKMYVWQQFKSNAVLFSWCFLFLF